MSFTGNADAGLNTSVSAPGLSPASGVTSATAAPGATGPGAGMSVGKSALAVVGVGAAGLLGLGILFRRGGKGLPPIRIDAVNVANVYFSWLLADATLTVLAYKYHGHPVAQAFLLIK
jgi:hypothetical protein